MTKALKKSDDINEPGCDLARIHVKYWAAFDDNSYLYIVYRLMFIMIIKMIIDCTNIFHDLNKDQIFPKPSHDQISNEEI